MADELRRRSHRASADLRELFGRMVFNALISNTDDHPRNHGLIAPGRDFELAPAYDLTPNPLVSVERRDLALSVGRFNRYANREPTSHRAIPFYSAPRPHRLFYRRPRSRRASLCHATTWTTRARLLKRERLTTIHRALRSDRPVAVNLASVRRD